VGNLVATQSPPFLPYLYFYSTFTDSRGLSRSLRIVPLARLDGNSATVAIDFLKSADFYEDYYYFYDLRAFTSGSLVLTALPPPITFVQVDEFYHPALRHYFMTASAAEKQTSTRASIPGGSGPGIVQGVRGGEQRRRFHQSRVPFLRQATSGPRLPLLLRACARVLRCSLDTHVAHGNGQRVPDRPARHVDRRLSRRNHSGVPNVESTGGLQSPIYTKTSIKAQMLAAGYLAEGYGPDRVVMCAL
jgi:hypothetical protein